MLGAEAACISWHQEEAWINPNIQTCFFPFPTGTICLWIFWPSFTSATTAHGSAEPWAVLNTYFSMAASTMATFVLSPVLYEESTLRMVGPLLTQTQVHDHEYTQGTRGC